MGWFKEGWVSHWLHSKAKFTSLKVYWVLIKFHTILLLKKELTNRSFKLSAQQKHPVKYEWYVAFALLGESNSNSGLEMYETAVLTNGIADSYFPIKFYVQSSKAIL